MSAMLSTLANNGSESEALEHLEFFFVYISPFIYSSAIIGSCFLLVILISQRKYTKLPVTINTAICCLLLSDLVTCIIWLAVDLSDRVSADSYVQLNKVVCLTFVYTLVTFCNLQGYIQCIISIERVLAVLMPMKVRRIITFWRMVVVLCIVLVVVSIIHIFYVIYGYSFSHGQCQLQDKVVMGVFKAIVYCGVPSVVQICSTVCIIVVLFKRHFRKKLISQSANRLPSNEIRLAIMLVVMNVMFVMTTLPITLLFFFLPNQFKSKNARQFWAYQGDIAWLLTMVGASTDWIVLLVLGRQIRTAIRRIFCRTTTIEQSSQFDYQAYAKMNHPETAC